MKRVITAAIMIPLALVVVFLKPDWYGPAIFTLAVTVFAALAGWEFMGLAERGGVKPPRVAVLVALAALFAVNYKLPTHAAAFFGVLCLALLVYCTFSRPMEQVLTDSTATVFCLFYIGFTLTSLPNLHEQFDNGHSLVAFLLCVVWAGDTAALYVGKAWGRHKLAPTLSPNKTWEGAWGSMAGSLAAAAILVGLAELMQAHDIALLAYPEDLRYWLILAAAVNVAAQVGDLAESGLKRSAGVKDSGSLLPGHGGVLDRIDALLIAAPVMWYAQVIHRQF